MRRPGGQHLFFAINQVAGVKGRDFKSVSVRDGVGGTSLYAVPAENAPRVIDVVDARVTFACRNAIGVLVFRCFNVNAIGRARRRARTERDGGSHRGHPLSGRAEPEVGVRDLRRIFLARYRA